MKINDLDEKKCCGCMACLNACPCSAIKIVENKNGFIYPKIDESLCINCGLCSNVCDFNKEHETASNIEHAYSLEINDKKALYESTSGGAFTAISDRILQNGGAVVGSIMEKDFSIHHVIAKNKETRNRMRRSKYVQSDVSSVFKPIKELLDIDVPVLFTGTPCQCAAIKSYLRKDYSNLLVVDFLCHGVPNNKMFKDHISFLEKYYGEVILDYTFRDKVYGWDSYNNNVYLSKKRKTRLINQAYYDFFVNNISLRPSCYNCAYRSLHRSSDITIADFWGIEKLRGKRNTKGVSLILTHSKKAVECINEIKTYAKIAEIPIEDVLYRIALKPAKCSEKADAFWEEYTKNGYQSVVTKFFPMTFSKQIRFEIRKIAKKLKLR